ncbi:MAG: hypothetical protein M3R48_05600 [Candidatus Dormibacteraeota bacterium]|nr:hypothetical protein [Candidatus Dormibacteraeota bacterium]
MRKKQAQGRPLVAVALGGNALLRREESMDIGVRRHNIGGRSSRAG